MASRQAYVQKLNAQLKEWDAMLDHLSAKAEKATADARINYENELESLKARRAVASKKIEELGQRGEDSWEDMKDGFEKVWDEMGKSVEKVAARFK